MRIGFVVCCLFLAWAPAWTQAAAAQEVKALGTFGKWFAATYEENGKPVCYMSEEPDSSAGDYTRRGKALMLITHRPAEKVFDVVSVVAGYEYLGDSDVAVSIGGQRVSMFTNGDRAWARDTATDQRLVQGMIKGATATVVGTSSRNTVTTDTYSLTGFTAAYKAISESCKKP